MVPVEGVENYTLDQMRSELTDASKHIEELLGVRTEVFAYPCGQTFIGRGRETKSYVPLVAELFVLGRLWLSEGPNDPSFCDFAQLTGVEMDGKDFSEMLPVIEKARDNHLWLVLAGHEMGDSGEQTTRLTMLQKLIDYANDPANGSGSHPQAPWPNTFRKKKIEIFRSKAVHGISQGGPN